MVESKTLKYLDPDLYVKAAGEGDIEQHYICLFCYGVVLDPTECRECQSLYCKGCMTKPDINCPKVCGSNEYCKVNRIVMNTLNKMVFYCQFHPKCEDKITYENYAKHFHDCDKGKLPECERDDCRIGKKNMEEQIAHLRQQLAELEIQKEKQTQVLKNHISDLKDQLKNNRPPASQVFENDEKMQKQNQELVAQIQALKLQIVKLEQLKNVMSNENPVAFSSKLQSVLCKQGHSMKQKSSHPFSSEVYCNICLKPGLLQQPFFFRCDAQCDFDYCAFCFHLELTDQRTLIQNIMQHAQLQKQQQQQAPQPFGVFGQAHQNINNAFQNVMRPLSQSHAPHQQQPQQQAKGGFFGGFGKKQM
eukprot:403355110